jgi:hypothetical protein
MEYLVEAQPYLFFLIEEAVPQELMATAIRETRTATNNKFFFIAQGILWVYCCKSD